MSTIRALSILCAVASAPWLAGCASHEAFVERHRAEYTALKAALNAPPGDGDSPPCDLDDRPAAIPFAYAEGLERFVDNRQTPRRGAEWDIASNVGSQPLVVSREYTEEEHVAFLETFARGEWIALVWVERVREGEVEELGSSDRRGTFRAGSASATVAIHELPSGEPRCWTSIHSRNSDELSSLRGANAVRDVHSDLAKQIRRDAIGAIHDLAPGVAVVGE